MKLLDINVLRDLSVKECIGLAKYLYPEHQWFYHHPYPDNIWEGHDIVSGKLHTITGYKATLRIDYRTQVSTEYPRILFQSAKGQLIPDNDKVLSYFRKINKID